MQIVQYMKAVIENNTFSFTDIIQFGEFQINDRAGLGFRVGYKLGFRVRV